MAVLVTRPDEQGRTLCQQLNDAGISALHLPLINIVPGISLSGIADELSQFDIIIAVSQHAVTLTNQAVVDNMSQWPAKATYLAVGQKTAHVLSKVTRQKVHYPQVGDSEHLLALKPLQNITNQRIVILRGNGGRELIFDTLISRGAVVEYREIYKRENIAFRSEMLVPFWQDRKIKQLVITSSGQLNHFISQIADEYLEWVLELTLYVPSERIVQEALSLGFKQVINTCSASNKDLLATLRSTETGQ